MVHDLCLGGLSSELAEEEKEKEIEVG